MGDAGNGAADPAMFVGAVVGAIQACGNLGGTAKGRSGPKPFAAVPFVAFPEAIAVKFVALPSAAMEGPSGDGAGEGSFCFAEPPPSLFAPLPTTK